MKNHYEFFDIYCMFRAMVKTQHNVVIKCFRCDLGGEYTFKKFFELLDFDGQFIKHLVLILLKRMELLKENIVKYLGISTYSSWKMCYWVSLDIQDQK